MMPGCRARECVLEAYRSVSVPCTGARRTVTDGTTGG
jgi:hypothetical protein